LAGWIVEKGARKGQGRNIPAKTILSETFDTRKNGVFPAPAERPRFASDAELV